MTTIKVNEGWNTDDESLPVKAETADAAIERIRQLLTTGLTSVAVAGRLVARFVDTVPGFFDMAVDKLGCPAAFLREIERIGRRQVHVSLYGQSGAGFRALKRMPYDTQCRYLEAPVDVVVVGKDGPDVLKVHVAALTPLQARQVFDTEEGVVRDMAAQRAWLASEQAQRALPEEGRKPYVVRSGKIVIQRPCEISLEEMGVIIAQMGR
jgi:hypothetical protein